MYGHHRQLQKASDVLDIFAAKHNLTPNTQVRSRQMNIGIDNNALDQALELFDAIKRDTLRSCIDASM